MPLLELFQLLREKTRDQRTAYAANQGKLSHRLLDVLLRTWDLGFTAFGGPNVHFQIFYARFVEGAGGKVPWVDEQTELFAICQGLPGPGSTKMLFSLVLLHAGLLPAVFVFLTWSLPGAIGMYALSLGVQRINTVLPDPVYALLSGINASTVGIIALAASQLASKAVKNRLLRVLVLFGACAGLCYNALWYFPVLMLLGGLAAMGWDVWLERRVGRLRARWARQRRDPHRLAEESAPAEPVPLRDVGQDARPDVAADSVPESVLQRRHVTNAAADPPASAGRSDAVAESPASPARAAASGAPASPAADHGAHAMRLRTCLAILALFVLAFTAIVTARGTLRSAPLPFSLFANFWLAGTIIFGGGPVVIPLLRAYVVQPGWVTPRDFLLGLAIIQAFPGPNFNFAVFLGALSLHGARARGAEYPSVLGALLGYVGIFAPGLTLALVFLALWRPLRRSNAAVAMLRGLNASAVGLVFTAVYRLWEIGLLSREAAQGRSLGSDPWWLVVAALAYAGAAWFGVPTWAAIVMGGVLGVSWWGAVGR